MKTREWTNEVYNIPPNKRTTTDYLYLFSKGTTEEYRKKYNVGDIFINGAICLHCKDFIRSMNGHDYKKCSCGKVGVDGGSWYIRRIGNPEDYIDVVEEFTKVGQKKKND